jgi:hypothetical protein
MVSKNLSVTSQSRGFKISKNRRVTGRIGKIFGTTLASGLLLSFNYALPSVALDISPANPQQKTIELAKKCQEQFGPNSAEPDKEAFKKCLKRVLQACVRRTDNPMLCKQWIKDAL